ncbi:glycosyltransferase family 2 protein [Mesoflavibacter sp. CH_XMU1422-2]|uniref:glycosyltransferase family 2 protein n=1 Tax=Mesoflavibacter sp. CH_XMU1422-2 TaxID=3107770 RepID=UPI003008EDE4
MLKQFVTIIIPTYNNSYLILETLNSVMAQNHNQWECIIVDDGSTDDTESIINDFIVKDNRFKILKRPPNRLKGANACRNIGLENSQGDYILFLDADDILTITCLENRLKEFKRDGSLDFVIAETSYYSKGVKGERSINKFASNTSSEKYLKHFLKYDLPWTTMSVLWKRITINNIRFDEKLPRLQDVDFHIRVLLSKPLHNFRLNIIDNYYRSEPGSKSTYSHHKKVIDASLIVFNKYLNGDYLNKKLKVNFRQFVIHFLINEIYPNQKLFKKQVNKIDKVIQQNEEFSNFDKMYLILYKILIKYNLYKIKGIGMFTITKAIKRKLNYE